MGRLQGKVALVTGGSRGIGAAIVLRYAEEGADVALTYSRSADRAKEVVAQVEAKGRRAVAIQADSADSAAVKAAVERVRREFDRLDILVNNAGVYAISPLVETSDEEFERVMAINVRAPFVAAREAAKIMGSGGRIINIGSALGERVPFGGLSNYSMSKFALAGLTRAWARDLGPRGITVNTIQPGPINTEMNPEDSDFADDQRAFIAVGRFGRSEEVAAAAAYLASDDAAYVTGGALNVDGGFVA